MALLGFNLLKMVSLDGWDLLTLRKDLVQNDIQIIYDFGYIGICTLEEKEKIINIVKKHELEYNIMFNNQFIDLRKIFEHYYECFNNKEICLGDERANEVYFSAQEFWNKVIDKLEEKEYEYWTSNNKKEFIQKVKERVILNMIHQWKEEQLQKIENECEIMFKAFDDKNINIVFEEEDK